MKILILIAFLMLTSVASAQHRSYNDRYYGYGIPLAPIQTPKRWMPYRQTPKADYYHQFGYGRGYTRNGHWFTYHFVIEY